jgi:hypothetical protein
LVLGSEWYVTQNGYLRRFWIDLGGKWHSEFLHRLIMSPPKGMEVDHVNGNKADNRRENLRVCTHAENMNWLSKRRAGVLTG